MSVFDKEEIIKFLNDVCNYNEWIPEGCKIATKALVAGAAGWLGYQIAGKMGASIGASLVTYATDLHQDIDHIITYVMSHNQSSKFLSMVVKLLTDYALPPVVSTVIAHADFLTKLYDLIVSAFKEVGYKLTNLNSRVVY